MSLLSTVEQLIKSYKVHQARTNESIQLYRELAQSLVANSMAGVEESEETDDTATGADASSEEQVDIELLEQALEKALRVRTSSEPSKNHQVKNVGNPKEKGTAVQQSSSKGNPTTVKSSYKSASLNRKVQKKAGSSISSSLGSRPSSVNSNCVKQLKTTNSRTKNPPVSSAGVIHHKAVSGSGSADHIPTLRSKNKTFENNMLSASDLRKAASVATPSSHTRQPAACSVPQQSGRVSSEQATKWKSLRCKQNRLWDKVMALQRKPVPGRSRFMERMRATFPKDWPTVAESLSHTGRDLLLMPCMPEEVPANQASKTDTEPEWKAWDRWRPEGGRLCTTGPNGVWGDGITAPLPLTITYTTEGELQELEKLRMRVALLRQELCLEQALLDTLAPQVSSIGPGPGCPDPSVLRDLYSLLGEGGEHFPAIVLDSEPD